MLAVARRDLAIVHAGRGWWRLPALALGLLLPAGGMPIGLERAPAAGLPVVAGEPPEALRGQVQVAPNARARLEGAAPVVVHAAAVSAPLRAALDTLPGPRVRPVSLDPPRRLPGRSLVVALLAISLLTGPLSESLPGERSGRTLEVLLSASLRRSELVLGKWLCWTLYGGGLALLAAAGGMASGVQAPGLWPLALPIVAGSAVALGFWLVRGAADEVAGAGVPMRVLPAAALILGGLGWAISGAHPALAALVPMGGALLVASGVLVGPGMLALAALGSGLAIAALLLAVARALDGGGRSRPDRARTWGPALLAPPLVWLPVAGPGLWAVAGNPNLALPEGAGVAAAGALAAALAAVLLARDGELGARIGGARGAALGALAGLALGALLRGIQASGLQIPASGALAPLLERLAQSPAEAGPLALGAWVLGQTLLFRAALPARLGWPASILLFTLAAHPLDPLGGLALGLGLAALARREGLTAAGLAQLVALLVAGRA